MLSGVPSCWGLCGACANSRYQAHLQWGLGSRLGPNLLFWGLIDHGLFNIHGIDKLVNTNFHDTIRLTEFKIWSFKESPNHWYQQNNYYYSHTQPLTEFLVSMIMEAWCRALKPSRSAMSLPRNAMTSVPMARMLPKPEKSARLILLWRDNRPAWKNKKNEMPCCWTIIIIIEPSNCNGNSTQAHTHHWLAQ